MASGERVRIEIAFDGGQTVSELDPADDPSSAGGAVAEVRVRTVSGDVRITRADGASARVAETEAGAAS